MAGFSLTDVHLVLSQGEGEKVVVCVGFWVVDEVRDASRVWSLDAPAHADGAVQDDPGDRVIRPRGDEIGMVGELVKGSSQMLAGRVQHASEQPNGPMLALRSW